MCSRGVLFSQCLSTQASVSHETPDILALMGSWLLNHMNLAPGQRLCLASCPLVLGLCLLRLNEDDRRIIKTVAGWEQSPALERAPPSLPLIALLQLSTVSCLGTSCPVGAVLFRFHQLLWEQSQDLTGITLSKHHKFVREIEKAIGFSKWYLHAFQENKQNLNFLSVCSQHPYNQNRKPSPSHRQIKHLSVLFPAKHRAKEPIRWFSFLSHLLGPLSPFWHHLSAACLRLTVIAQCRALNFFQLSLLRLIYCVCASSLARLDTPWGQCLVILVFLDQTNIVKNQYILVEWTNTHTNLFRHPSKTKVRLHSLHLADEKGDFEDVKKPAQIEQHPGDGEPSSVSLQGSFMHVLSSETYVVQAYHVKTIECRCWRSKFEPQMSGTRTLFLPWGVFLAALWFPSISEAAAQPSSISSSQSMEF